MGAKIHKQSDAEREKGKEKGFERMQDEDMAEVDAASEMERAKREVHDLEERRALTMGGEGNAAPKVKLTASKSSGIARSRHQLATMLHEAYNNREALEEKIAQGRRNRKEAGWTPVQKRSHRFPNCTYLRGH